jgi:MFS transporter, DHA2 family, multidrug resistance protein
MLRVPSTRRLAAHLSPVSLRMNVAAGLPVPLRYWAILSIGLGVTLAVLDGAIANVALPTIAHNLQVSDAASIWVINAYQLAVIMTLLPFASLGEKIGYRNVYLPGMIVFTLASLGCALAHDLPMLVVMRVIQGLGASGIMCVNTALLRLIFPASQLGRGIAINSMVVALGSAVGPTLASVVLLVAPWPWLFAINVPIGIAAIAVGRFALPGNPGHERPYDYLSALLNAGTFGLLVFGVSRIGHADGYTEAALILLAAGVIGWIFVQRQLRQPVPLLPVDLLRIRQFALSIGTSLGSFAAQTLAFIALPFWLEYTLGYSQVETGLYMTSWPLVILLVAPFAGRMSDRHPAGLLCGIGLILMCVGLALLATLGGSAPNRWLIVACMALCGSGFGLFQAPNNRAIISAAPHERSGGASGMLSTARLAGQTLAAALVAVIFELVPRHGPALVLALASAFALSAAVISVTRLRNAAHNAA